MPFKDPNARKEYAAKYRLNHGIKPRPPKRVPECGHPNNPYRGLGLCRSCYDKSRHKKELSTKSVRKIRLAELGLSLEDYDKLFESQNGGCAICGGQNPSGNRLAVDHSHTTKKVRGLLCVNCNMGLGCFKDTPKLLLKGLNYIMENGG
mgnify:CR=1 FL=1